MAKTLREIAVEIAKSDGALTPEIVNIGGTLRAEQSNKMDKPHRQQKPHPFAGDGRQVV